MIAARSTHEMSGAVSRFSRLQSVLRGAFVAGVAAFSTLDEAGATSPRPADRPHLSPAALVASPDGRTLFIACATANQLAVFDAVAGRIVRAIALPDSPSGLTLSPDGAKLFVTCASPASTVCVIATATGRVAATIRAGHTAMAPVLSPDGETLYVCHRFDHAVAFIDLARGRERGRVSVPREPVAAAVTPDGRLLLVANHLHHGRADADHVAATVSVIETATQRIVHEIGLPNGSGLLRDVRISPDGRFAAVTHLVARYQQPTTQLERGWINTNALTVIDLTRRERLNTVLLDNVDRGAANPWAIAWSPDGKLICVTHAGTHEVSLIDAAALLAKLDAARAPRDVPNDLGFLVGLRQRIALAPGIGPRAITIAGTKAYVANYFSDSLSVIDLAASPPLARSIPLAAPREASLARQGERLWNDARICFQGWQSCSSCHSSDARVDGLNWDNLNDGLGNPKNAKSLLLAHRTPPAMWTGVRDNASAAVRAGIKHILFAERPEAEATALDRYLESLQPIPSPRLVRGKLSAAAKRGEAVFNRQSTGCAVCHAGPLFTDQKSYDVGTAREWDLPDEEFDTPSLIEVWRTAPYLHDGSAATMFEVLTTANAKHKHGSTRQLTPAEMNDLVEYLLSL